LSLPLAVESFQYASNFKNPAANLLAFEHRGYQELTYIRSTVRQYARATRSFKTEADAKLFARKIVENGWTASAGTLNPHLPKKIVSPNRVLDWIGS